MTRWSSAIRPDLYLREIKWIDTGMPLISIIMPVHNSAQFLGVALDSILSQTEDCWEALCFDDASSDDSLSILKAYSKKEARIRVFHGEVPNGAGHARNFCIDKSSGEFLMFCDSDDWLEPNACEKMLEKVRASKYDFVQCHAMIEASGNATPPCNIEWFNPPVGKFDFFRRPHRGINSLCWEKIIRRDFLDHFNIRFPQVLKHEDDVFCAECAIAAKKTAILPLQLYHYRLRAGSLMQTNRADENMIWRSNVSALTSWAEDNGFSNNRLVWKYCRKWQVYF